MSRILRSLIAQRVSSKSQLEQIASQQGWEAEELQFLLDERFGTGYIESNRFESYMRNLASQGWDGQSVQFLKRNVENCANVLFKKNSYWV